MQNEFDFRPGVYVVDNKDGLLVRSQPDTTKPGNLIGRKFLQGKRFPVYKVITAGKGEKWGIISAPDVHTEQTLYVCIWNLQTLFASPVGGGLDGVDLTDLEAWVSALERDARILQDWKNEVSKKLVSGV